MSSNGTRMTDQPRTPTEHTPECRAFAQQLGDYLEGDLAASAQQEMDAHRHSCAACHAFAAETEAMVQQASALPVMTPSRDLWSGIESRLTTDVIPLPPRLASGITSSAVTTSLPMRRTVSVRAFAVAAALLVTVSSAVTWRVARVRPQQGQAQIELAQRLAPTVPSDNVIDGARDTIAAMGVDDAIPATLVAASPAEVDEIYEREITSLRTIVTERFTELDSTTVVELRRNLAIIDAAIADSRKALERDPNSRLLSSQLDRALETKLALMRRVALL